MVSEGGSRFALNHNGRDLKVRWEKHRLKEGVLGSRLNGDLVVVLGLESRPVGLQTGGGGSDN